MNTAIKKIKLNKIKRFVLDGVLSEDKAVVEQALTIQVDNVCNYTLLCTPIEIESLMVGFLYAEGLISSYSDIDKISQSKTDPQIFLVQIKSAPKTTTQKNLLVTSSCGLCASRDLQAILDTMPICGDELVVRAADLSGLIQKLQRKQLIFKQTGATHAAGIFNAAGEIISFGEDLGRHSALDKAIGGCLLKNCSMKSCGVVLSSRISFEMVVKAARAGIEMIVAVSAPSSLAIRAAEKWNITLCGFVRGESANVYSGMKRII